MLALVCAVISSDLVHVVFIAITLLALLGVPTAAAIWIRSVIKQPPTSPPASPLDEQEVRILGTVRRIDAPQGRRSSEDGPARCRSKVERWTGASWHDGAAMTSAAPASG